MSVIVQIPRDARVFVLEDSMERITWFANRFGERPGFDLARDADAGLALIAAADPPYDFVFLDHDLEINHYRNMAGYNEHRDTGYRVAHSMAERGYLGDNVLIHSWNPQGAANMAACFERSVFVIPFGRFEIDIVG
jgi:hypothetical protein